VYSNLRGDVPAKLGLRYADLAHINPTVVCCSLSAFGMSGPRHDEPGYDYIVQGLAGWMSITGEPDAPPTKTGLSLVDWAAGLVAAGTVLAGLHAARRDGVGMDCDVSMHDVALNLHAYLATWVLTAGYEPQRTRHSAHPSLVPFQNVETADGWLVVGCAKEKFWHRLTGELGRPDLAQDPRFADFASRSVHADALLAILEPLFREDTTAGWVGRLSAAGVPCGPVNNVGQALQDLQVSERGLVMETEHPVLGRVRQLASPFNVGDWREPARRAPLLDEDGARVLAELGLAAAEVAERRMDE
jgi:crotonobetainyl-CoA:carnitine CoA-transferase CaiB-like acyl-CoA transferase